ncbi:hypothetical protein AGMMS49975_06590 [Clostridia bacterium]|nr:hypothetical protein AGMMS49975_06590 [Clostridia bacterium]
MEVSEEAIAKKQAQLDKLTMEIEQLEQRKNTQLKRERSQAYKERTRRLIQMGAITEKYLGTSDTAELEKWLKEYVAKNR